MTDPYQAHQEKRPPQHQERQPGHEEPMVPKPIFIRDSYRGSKKLQDKVAIITGGDSGIGRAVAVHFAREGADVAIVYLEEHQDAEATQQLVEQEDRRCLLLSGDVSDEEFCHKVVTKTLNEFGKLDILVNNAAEQHPRGDLGQISSNQLMRTFQTNIYGYFFLTQAALDHLKEGSAIINTTSVTAYRGSTALIDYSSTKGAILSFTRSLARSLIKQGIRVNGVAPGPIWTPLIPASFPDEAVETFGSQTPMGRAGQPAELGPAYVFLASEDASYVSGEILHVNGGDFVET